MTSMTYSAIIYILWIGAFETTQTKDLSRVHGLDCLLTMELRQLKYIFWKQIRTNFQSFENKNIYFFIKT